MTDPTTIVVATDSFLIGEGLCALLEDVTDVTVVGRVDTHAGLAELVATRSPDVVILSIRNPLYATQDTLRAARRLREENPETGIVVICERGDGFALELPRHGSSRLAYLRDDSLPDLPPSRAQSTRSATGAPPWIRASSTTWCSAPGRRTSASPTGRPRSSSSSPTACRTGRSPPRSTCR